MVKTFYSRTEVGTRRNFSFIDVNFGFGQLGFKKKLGRPETLAINQNEPRALTLEK